MKRYGNLIEKIASIENIEIADKKARKGKTKSLRFIREHDKHKEEDYKYLSNALLTGTYKTSKYDTFKIYEPKERVIYRLPYFPDRVAHHAIMNVMEPIWVSQFIPQTYSCIKGRGIHKAMKNIKRDLRKFPEETKYCLKMDIRKFYPSIDHEILKQIIRKKIKDKVLLTVLDEIIDSTDGVPIGNYLSQFFANLYLAYFDRWCKEELKCRFYYRYADDITILSGNKEFLHNARVQISKYLQDNLKLELKPNYQVFPVDIRGIDFLGYIFRHKYTLLRKSIKLRLYKVIRKIRILIYQQAVA